MQHITDIEHKLISLIHLIIVEILLLVEVLLDIMRMQALVKEQHHLKDLAGVVLLIYILMMQML